VRKLGAVVMQVLLMALLGGCAYVNVPLVTRPASLEEQVLEGTGAGDRKSTRLNSSHRL